MTIKKKLGARYMNMPLFDLETPYASGGKAYSNETLGDFMEEAGITGDDEYSYLEYEMTMCGVSLQGDLL